MSSSSIIYLVLRADLHSIIFNVVLYDRMESMKALYTERLRKKIRRIKYKLAHP
jgi:hypothetical protein